MKVKLEPFQDSFIFSEARFPAFVAAWGTGKTMCLIIKAVMLAEKYPNNLGAIFRKEYTDLRDSTIVDFEKYTGMKVNSNRNVDFPNGSRIMFRHIEEMNNIQNINLGFFALEQAEELDSDDMFFKLKGRLRREGIDERQGFIIANTNGHNWIYKLWKMGNLNNASLSEATTFDNKHNLPKDFIDDLKDMKEVKPKIYNRFVLNSWKASDVSDIIIHPSWVEHAVGREIIESTRHRTVIACDPARYGDDETSIYVIRNNQVIFYDHFHKKQLMETAGRLFRLRNKHKAQLVAIDSIGLGAGLADRLQEMGVRVYEIKSSEKAKNPEEYYNVRAEMWFEAGEKFYNGEVSIPQDDLLIEQLSAVKYETRSKGQLKIESKDNIKKRIGRSPDRADALVMGLYACDKAEEQKMITKIPQRRKWSY